MTHVTSFGFIVWSWSLRSRLATLYGISFGLPSPYRRTRTGRERTLPVGSDRFSLGSGVFGATHGFRSGVPHPSEERPYKSGPNGLHPESETDTLLLVFEPSVPWSYSSWFPVERRVPIPGFLSTNKIDTFDWVIPPGRLSFRSPRRLSSPPVSAGGRVPARGAKDLYTLPVRGVYPW